MSATASRLRILSGVECELAMLVNIAAFCLLVAVSAAPVYDDQEVDDASLATRTLLAAAVFDGRVVAPIVGGRLLFRVRRIYKGWHADVDSDQRVTRLKSSDFGRLVYVSCGSADFGELVSRERSDGCRLRSAVIGRRYFVYAESFRAVVVNFAGRNERPLSTTPIGVYRTSGPLVPVTIRSRRIAVQYSDLRFGK